MLQHKLHLQGKWVALLMVTCLITFFSGYSLARFSGRQPKIANQDAEKSTVPGVPAGSQVYVDKVVDGDTFKVRGADGNSFRIRVRGVDCPESHRNDKCERDGQQGRKGCDEQIPLGLEAARIAAKLAKHKQVILEGPISLDRYGRVLAYVRLPDGSDYGAFMVKEGLCEDFGWKYPHPRMPYKTKK